MTAKELQNSAIPSLQKFCEETFCLTIEELTEFLRENHTIEEKLKERLIKIANGYRVRWNLILNYDSVQQMV